MKIDGMKIDARIAKLVRALNLLPGCTTFSSCGGHRNPGPGQVPAGEFSVSLDFDRTKAGWHALELLTSAVWETDCEHIALTTWRAGDEPESMAFSLAGKNGADPDALAAILMALLEYNPSGCLWPEAHAAPAAA